MFGSTKTKIICEADVSNIQWCDSAVIVSVKNGKGTLTHIGIIKKTERLQSLQRRLYFQAD